MILVEGRSDQAALEALAERTGQPLGDRGLSIAAMGGATNVEHVVGRLGPRGLGVRLAGLSTRLLVGALRPGRVPRPLRCVLAHAADGASGP